jgi:Tfp pilus assembly protein PilF
VTAVAIIDHVTLSGSSSAVERRLPKPDVAGSIPVSRSSLPAKYPAPVLPALNPFYNLGTLICRRNSLLSLLVLAILPLSLLAQQRTPTPSSLSAGEKTTSKLLVVIPFENVSSAPGLDWIGEAFAQLITDSISSPSLYTIGREDRSYAFDRLGIPLDAHLSRATLYRIAERMDVDYLIFGSYNYDGTNFTARGRLLNMRKLRLSQEAIETGSLPQLIDIQHALAWDMLHEIDPSQAISKQSFVASAERVRLDALENYIRGVIATDTVERVRRLKEALRINPDYALADYQLGKAYFDAHDYRPAVLWLAKVPKEDKHTLEAHFYLGLAAYYMGSLDRAEEAFDFVASRLPLTEVYNNLGVVQSRRGKKTAIKFFEKAIEADLRDADYHFNLGLALLKTGDTPGGLKQLKEALAIRPGDSEIKAAIESSTNSVSRSGGSSPSRVPLERIKRNYDEASFRQLSLEIQRVDELRLAQLDSHTHALKHVERGRDLLRQGFKEDAQKEFREAVTLDPSIADAHLGLATVEEAENDLVGARSEASAALKLQATASAYLLLAQIDLKQNNPQSASENIRRALALEPANGQAKLLQESVATKLGETVKNQ